MVEFGIDDGSAEKAYERRRDALFAAALYASGASIATDGHPRSITARVVVANAKIFEKYLEGGE